MTTYTAPVLNSVTLPSPDQYEEYVGVRGGTTVLADGSLRRQLVQSGNKRRFVLGWTRLTGTQKTTLETALNSAASASRSFTAPTGSAYTVVLDQGADELQFTAYTLADGTMLFKAGPFTLRET